MILTGANEKELGAANGPFLSLARFGPGAIIILAFLILLGFFLFLLINKYLALLPIAVALIIFGVISVQIIDEKKVEERKIIGQKCFVVERVSKEARGLVRIYRDDGTLDPELWSAETKEGTQLEAKSVARVVGIRSVILLVAAGNQ